jgi:predicted acylesterase/phospholipase RssA
MIKILKFPVSLKKIVPQTALLLLLFLAAWIEPRASEVASSKIGLVLSGGGARGLAQIGVLKAFEEHGIKPDFMVGSSMGALIAAFYSAGYSADSIQSIAHQIDWDDIFSNSAARKKLFVSQKTEPATYLLELRFSDTFKPILPRSISYGQQLLDILPRTLAPAQFRASMNFDSLQIPLRIVATDIVSGQRIVLKQGNIATALRASSAIPLAFAPVIIDSTVLMDGGLLSNIPVDVAREQGCDFVVAVDVTSPLWQESALDNPVHLVDQIIAIGISHRKQQERTQADIIITPALPGYLNTDFSNIDTLIQRGYKAAMEHIGAIQQAYQSIPRALDSSNTYPLRLPLLWEDTDTLVRQDIEEALTGLITERGGVVTSAEEFREITDQLSKRLDYPFLSLRCRASSGAGTRLYARGTRLEQVKVVGNRYTANRKIVRALSLEAQQHIHGSLIQQVISTLYSTGLFNTVNADLVGEGTLRIFVQEKNPLGVRMGLRFDEFHLGEAYIQPVHENLLGRGIELGAHLHYGLRREKYAVELRTNQLITPGWANYLRAQTYISRERIVEHYEIDINAEPANSSDPSLTASAGLDSLIQSEPGIIEYREESIRKIGVQALVGTQLGRFMMMTGSIKIEQFEAHQTSNIDKSVWSANPAKYNQGVRSLSLALHVDNLDRFPFPRDGHRHHVQLSAASDLVGGTANFLKANGSFSYAFTPVPRHTFVPQLAFMWASSALPVVERVFMGGVFSEERSPSLRIFDYVPFTGLAPRSLPGDCMVLSHVEYRFGLSRQIFFSATLDWGAAWLQEVTPQAQMLSKNFPGEAPLGIGLGVAALTPVGPLRFSWGRLLHQGTLVESIARNDSKKWSKYHVYFSLGHDF